MTTRRSFLQQAAMISAGVLIGPSCVLSNTAGSKGAKKVGLQLYTLREFIGKDPRAVLAKVAAAGYKEVETYGYSKENGYWGLKPAEFKQVLDSNGLTAPSGHYGFDAVFGGDQDVLKDYIDAAKTAGHTYITVPYLAENMRKSADDYKSLAEKLSKAAEVAKKGGLQLTYHNHDFEFQDQGGTTGYDIFLKETDADLLKFELDLYWVVRAGRDWRTLFNENKGRFVMWHVKDMDKNDPKSNADVGTGSINFSEIFEQAKTAGVKHYFVEQENHYDSEISAFDSIKNSVGYVTNTLLK